MGLFNRLLPARIERKSLARMVHSSIGNGQIAWFFDNMLGDSKLPATREDYAKEVGDGMGSSVLAAPLNFLLRTFPEAPPIVERRWSGLWKESEDHALTQLLATPNPFYAGRTLWMATVLDFAFGNAYWLKIRNLIGEVVELWWVPRSLMQPRWPSDGSTFISHYEYMPGGQSIRIAPRDVIHFRFGIDPHNTRLGMSPLAALVREIAVDDRAANFTATILKNLGIVGVIVSPKEGSAKTGAYEETKKYLEENFTGDNRGRTLALGRPTDVQLLQYNLQGFDVAPIRDVSEERVCAALGLPAAVVGFGTGLHQTKVGATMKEMRQLTWTGGIIPLQDQIADEINRSLLTEFAVPEKGGMRMRFDTSKVRALWEDANEKHLRIREDYKAGLIDRATALAEMGRPHTDADKGVYFQASAATSLDPTADPAKPPADATTVDDEEPTTEE